jgi:endonuclease/exonuclease/phosphatase family metal-dependent hydrolase
VAGRSSRGPWVVLLGGLLAVACTSPAAPTPPVRVLQLNLCSSGAAGCYTGRSTDEAAAVVRAEAPDLVTLNEVCRDDLAPLERALAEVGPGSEVTSAFQAARNAGTGAPYQCRNGEHYGIGIVARWPSVPGSPVHAGIHPAQDPGDPEERAWLCLDVAALPAVSVCTTHLAHTDREVAVAQCRHLFGTVVARLRAREGAAPVVVGGDLNLGASGDPHLASCLPADSALADDGGRQHIVATPEFDVDGSRTIDLRGATDHPGLLVTLAPRADGPR